MPQDFDPIQIDDDGETRDDRSSPFIRISRSNGTNASFADGVAMPPARPRRTRTAATTFADDFEPVDERETEYAPEPRPRRANRERPMPRRLTDEIPEEPVVRQREPRPATSSTPKRATKTKRQKEAEQIALNLKAEKKPDNTVKQRQVLGVLLIMFAVLVTLSIVSYTPQDAASAETKFSDLPAIFTRTDPIVNAHADTAQNWLGLIGAMLADFLINKTIGYAAIIYPIFFGWWSLALFKFTTRQRRRLTLATTFFLITAVLFSATIGTTQLISFFYHLPREWSGAVGQFMGVTSTRLIGAVGALIVYFTAFLITLVFSIDLDIEKTFLRVKGYNAALATTLRRRLIEFQEAREAKREAKIAREAEIDQELITEPEVTEIEDIDEDVVVKPAMQEPKTAVDRLSTARAAVKSAPQKPVESHAPVDVEHPERAPSPEVEPIRDILSRGAEAVKIMRGAAPALGATAATAQQAPLGDQPMLKVRPIPKSDKPEIPRITKPSNERLGEKNLQRLSNGAAIGPAAAASAAGATPAPAVANEIVSAQASEVTNKLPEPPSAEIAEIAETSVESTPVASPEPTLTPIEKIRIRKEPPVMLGDEKALSNEALPHSISSETEIRDVVAGVKRTAIDEEEDLFEANAPRVLIPENPYNENLTAFRNPGLDLLTPSGPEDELDADDEELAMKGRLLRDKLATFGVAIENITVTPGPVVTLYEFTPAEGVKVSRVENLTDDIALAMKARGIRIIAPIPGRGTIGVEIPNDVPKMVRIRSLFESAGFRNTKMNLPLALGKTISGDVYVDDLNKMPHLLIAGATGAGKSVGVNGIIASLLYAKSPKDVKFVIVDPKKIELSLYKKLRKHYLIVSPEAGEDIVTTPQFAVLALKAVELEMEARYDKLAKAAVRSLSDYNTKVAQGKLQSTQAQQHYHLPYIVVIIDELADLMITAGRDIEEPICRIAQMARAVGIHLILATQRPSVDVITGVIKANFPARMAFQVATRVDSRTILDSMGAEQLLGNGDMLYQPSGTPKAIRLQSPFITTEEVEAIVDAVAAQEGDKRSYSRPWTLPSLKQKANGMSSTDEGMRDDLFEEAARIIVRHQQGSVSLLQRRLKVGYSRAARIVDELEQAGIVGPFDGSKARQVICENEEELELVFEGLR